MTVKALILSSLALLFAAIIIPTHAPAQSPVPERQAARILEACGIRGGLIVHVGCGDGGLTAALRVSEAYRVHGLDGDPERVERARAHIRSLGLYGPVCVDRLGKGRLPYIDNLANLVICEDPGAVSMDEVLRVLCPGGAAHVRRDGEWTLTVKPRPEAIDEWTH